MADSGSHPRPAQTGRLSIYVLGYYQYVCDPRLRPLVDALRQRGHEVVYHQDWDGRDYQSAWEAFLADRESARLFLLACDLDGEGHDLGRRMVWQARDNHIPSVSIQHGHFDSTTAPPTADTVCVWGPAYADRIDVPGERIVFTGNPTLDHPPDRLISRIRVARCLEREVTPYALMTVPLTMNIPRRIQRRIAGGFKMYDRAIAAVSAKLPVIMRPHPRIDRELHLYHRLAHDYQAVLWPGDTPGCGLRTLYMGASLVFGYSTVLLEAAICGVPALQVRLEPTDEVDDRIYFHWKEDDRSIGSALNAPYSLDFARAYNTEVPGEATRRIVDVIEEKAATYRAG